MQQTSKFSIRFDVAAGGLNVKNASGSHGLRNLLQSGASQMVGDVIRQAGLADQAWKILVVQGFTNSDSKIPLLSGFQAQERGVRVRYRPTHTRGAGWILLWCPDKYPADQRGQEAMRDRLVAAAKACQGDEPQVEIRTPADDPAIAQAAADLVAGLPRNWKSFDLFVKAVAEEAGPGEDPEYWRQALNAAANLGLLHHGSNCYVPATEPGRLAVDHDRVPAQPAPTPSANGQARSVDEEAMAMLAENADAIVIGLNRVRELGANRKKLLADRDRIDHSLAENAAAIKEAAKNLPMSNLALAAGVLG